MGHTVHSIGIHPPVDDVFELLNESLVRERYSGYPGHAIAQREFETATQAGHASSKKAFLQDRWKAQVSEATCAGVSTRDAGTQCLEPRLESVLLNARSSCFSTLVVARG